MFDIGFPELILVAVVVLLVLGPERLPEALRTAGLWIGRLQRSFNSVKTEIEREIGMDEIRRQLHNESVMAEMQKLQQDLKSNSDPRINGSLNQSKVTDANNILPEDSMGFDAEPPAPGAEPPDTEAPGTAIADAASPRTTPDPGAEEPESESETVARLQREAAFSEADTGAETVARSGTDSTEVKRSGSGSDDEQRA